MKIKNKKRFKEMAFRGFLLIIVLPTCRTQSAADYDVKSPGAVLGIILGATVLIVATIIVIVICVKRFWRKKRQRRKQKTNTNKKKIVPQKPQTITETLVERLPDIPEEDENVRGSCVSIRDESKLTLYQIATKSNESKQASNIKEDMFELVEIQQKPGSKSITSVEVDKRKMKSDEVTSPLVKQDEKLRDSEEIVKEINTSQTKKEEQRPSSKDIVQEFTTTHIKQEEKRTISEGVIESINRDSLQAIKDDLSVTRVIKNESTLQKDLPLLNSTEKIFSEYDPAMMYKADSVWNISKSEEGLNLINTKCEQTDIATEAFEFTRDDSDLNLKSQSKMEAEKQLGTKIDSRSVDMLNDDKKSISLKRRSSLISRITSKSLEWNFDYISPYAMTDQQKRERFELKQKMKKQRLKLLRQKHAEKEKKKHESNLAFEKWKRQKQDENSKGDIGKFNTRISNRYRFWYP